MPRTPKGTPTGTNLYVFGTYAKRIDDGERITRVPPTDHPHLKRVLAAGLLAISREQNWLTVTPEGRAVLATDRSAQQGYGVGNDPPRPASAAPPAHFVDQPSLWDRIRSAPTLDDLSRRGR